MKTDYEKYRELFDGFGVHYEVDEGDNLSSEWFNGVRPDYAHTEIKPFYRVMIMESNDPKEKTFGYGHFHSVACFDKDGAFLGIGFFE